MMRTVFITGANRGIGLEFARQYLGRGDRVFATSRNLEKAVELQHLASAYPKRMSLITLDVTNQDDIENAFAFVQENTDHLDILINNAGIIYRGETPENYSADILKETFETNAIAPMMVAQKFLPLLEKGISPKIVNITSQLGSITRKTFGGHYSYSGSKAALNMLTRTLAFDLRSRGIIVVVIHPGWVKTDMGGEAAPIRPADSVSGMISLIDSLSMEETGSFLSWDGSTLPW